MSNVAELLERWVATFNDERWGDVLNFSAADAVEEEIGTGRTMTREQSLEAAKAWKAAFPDARGQIFNRVISGNQAAAQVVWEGTHKGEFNGIPPTGRKLRVHAAVFLEERGSKIVRVHHYIDVAGMLTQLGVMPGPSPEAQLANAS